VPELRDVAVKMVHVGCLGKQRGRVTRLLG
jgi:hypothetical protein